jgi:hypothetical protein
LRTSFSFLPACVAILAGPVSPGHAEIGKAHLILLDRGLQVQALCKDDCYVHLDTYSNANYTALNWINESNYINGQPVIHASRPEWMGPPPGFPWARWALDPGLMPPLNTPYGSEAPYLSQLVSISLSDEPNLYDPAVSNRLVTWFNSAAPAWPNTILFINNWGGQINDATLSGFIRHAHPDLISFDTYPWKSVYDINAPGHIGAAIPGPPTPFYGDLRRYRAWASAFNTPFGIYRQTFHAVEEYYPFNVYRDPSPSELRLNTTAALAFGAKMLVDFTYNTGATALFDIQFNGSGDSFTNALYQEIVDVNLRARNLGKALVRLTPVYDLHTTNNPSPPPGPGSDDPAFPDGYTTSIMFLRGKCLSGGVTNFTPVPDSFLNDPSSSTNSAAPNSLAYTWWEFGKNDPYLSGFSFTNTAGSKNNGLNGDVIISWLRPLDESMDGTVYSNQVYIMVVNGLTAPDGTAADCLQEIRLDFSGLTGPMTNLILLSPLTGQLTTNGLPPVSTKRRLTLSLNGGDAALFKFNTGAPFVGLTPIAAKLGVQALSGTPCLSIEGAIGSAYRLEAAPALPAASWIGLTNVMLRSSPHILSDLLSAATSNRFFRAVSTP